MFLNGIIEAIICGIVWAITHLYINKGLNPKTKDHMMYYKEEAIYGGMAVFSNVILILIIGMFLNPK